MTIFADSASPGAIQVQKNGVNTSFRPTVNLIPGTDISITVADDPTHNRANVTIAATASQEIDGGFANSVYLISQIIDGGNAFSF